MSDPVDQALEDYFSDLLSDSKLGHDLTKSLVGHKGKVQPETKISASEPVKAPAPAHAGPASRQQCQVERSASVSLKAAVPVKIVEVDQRLEKQKLQILLNSSAPKEAETPKPIPEKARLIEQNKRPQAPTVPKERPELASTRYDQEIDHPCNGTETPTHVPPVKQQHTDESQKGTPGLGAAPFDALLFCVGGLTLAVPLVELGQIYPMSEELTPLFGQAKWFMGLLPSPSGKVYTVNTAMFVMPERYNPDECKFKFVVTLANSHWGLAVDEVRQPTRLTPEDVTWRGQRSKRPWLAGTVKSAMCALIDTRSLERMLSENDLAQ